MKKHKPDIISESEFTKMNVPKEKHHYPLPEEVIPEDENSDPLEETLMGMEYDLEEDENIIYDNDDDIPDEDLDYLMSELKDEGEEDEMDREDDEASAARP